MRALIPRLAVTLTLGALVAAAPAAAQVFAIVDETGVTHYTNTPCLPQYTRLAPELCPPPPEATVTETAPGDFGSATLFWGEIQQVAARYEVDPRLVAAVVLVESSGNPRAVSRKGARGLMQLMPERAAQLGVLDVFDPIANLDGGVRHLRALLEQYGGDVRLALAAYNAGAEAVRAYGGIPPYPETQAYVRSVLARYTPAPAPPTPPKRLAPRVRL